MEDSHSSESQWTHVAHMAALLFHSILERFTPSCHYSERFHDLQTGCFSVDIVWCEKGGEMTLLMRTHVLAQFVDDGCVGDATHVALMMSRILMRSLKKSKKGRSRVLHCSRAPTGGRRPITPMVHSALPTFVCPLPDWVSSSFICRRRQ